MNEKQTRPQKASLSPKRSLMSEKAKSLLTALAVSGILTLFAGIGLLNRLDRTASDLLYQQRESSDGKIVILGIDQEALEVYGPYNQWSRDITAQALETLNQSDDCRPAVIGIDILFAGESQPEVDDRLAKAAGAFGNVITPCLAAFSRPLLADDNGGYTLGASSVTSLEDTYASLRAVTGQGHINAMLDGDGVLRHHLLCITQPQGEQIPSLALACAQSYLSFQGKELQKLPPTSPMGFWYLPFCGIPGDFEEISIVKVLSGEVSPAYFSGKIVLIGPYAPGLQDSYVTASDHASPMYGVEYQANAIQALLWGRYKAEVGNGPQLTLLFLILLLAAACFWKRPVWLSTLLWMIFCAGWLLLGRWLYDMGWVLHVLWIPVGTTVLYVGCLAANYIQAAIERQRVTGTFKRYVAPEIVNELLREGTDCLDLGGTQTTISVLFVDVRGFTSMSEELNDPRKVVEILNRYLTLFSDCILQNGGTLDKFVGDQAMAFWGAPLRHENNAQKALQAVQTAMDMVAGGQKISAELKEQYGRTVSFGIGIHLGEAVVGNIGSPKRMDYTAIGDTVNTAARLEANAPGETIYISRAVADVLSARIRATSLGDSVKLKGKKEGFEVLKLEEILPEE